MVHMYIMIQLRLEEIEREMTLNSKYMILLVQMFNVVFILWRS